MVTVRHIPACPSSQRLKTRPAALEGRFGQAGGTLVMSPDRAAHRPKLDALLALHAQVDRLLPRHGSANEPWLFDGCGQVKAVVGPYASAPDLGLLPAAAGAWR